APGQFAGRPGPAPADRIFSAGASIARLLLADRDPVASMLIARRERVWLPPGLGERHLMRLLLRMVSFSTPLPDESLDLAELTTRAWTCGFHHYPELFDATINPGRGHWYQLSRRWQQQT